MKLVFATNNLNKLSEIVFSSDENQQLINSVVWPEVSLLINNAANKAKDEGIKLFIVEVI